MELATDIRCKKKALSVELETYFPAFGSSGGRSLDVHKRYYLALVADTLNSTPETRQSLENNMKQIYKQNKPQKYTPGPGNVLLEHKKSFESNCALIEEHFSVNVKSLSTFEFYSRIESIKDKFKRQSESYARPDQ